MTQRSDPRSLAITALVSEGLVTEDSPVVGLVDTDAVLERVQALHAAFPADIRALHTVAAKAASLTPVLGLLAAAGMGCEVASPGELALAVGAGFPADRIVFDSPAKTPAELREALRLGVALNIDNREELERVVALVGAQPPTSPIGFRINPQVGAGGIGAMSTATDTSKFGFPLRDPGARAAIIDAYLAHPWLTQIHCHVGSQGCPLPLMATGIRDTYLLAEEINAAAGRAQITRIDLGGGLPVNFDSDEITPDFPDYVAALTAAVPELFDGRYELVTEFGRSLLAKSGMMVSRVEYVKESGGRPIAITHAGAQVATRTVFMPESWPLRIGVRNPDGSEKTGPVVVQDVAGPCCFAGDVIARGRELPRFSAGDLAVVYDTGAYYFSTHFAYNSLPRVPVYGYRVREDRVEWSLIRRQQTIAEVVRESGVADAAALTARHEAITP